MNSTEGGHSRRVLPKGSVLVLCNMYPQPHAEVNMSHFKSPVALALIPSSVHTGTIGHLEMLGASKKAASNPEKPALQQMETMTGKNVNYSC